MMDFGYGWITGFSIGFEFVDDEDDGSRILAVDLGILRLVFFY